MKKRVFKQVCSGLMCLLFVGSTAAGPVFVSPVARLPAQVKSPEPAPQSSAAEVTSNGSDERVVVKEGEQFRALAQRHLNRPQMWREWANYNGLENVNHLRSGQVLWVPQAWLRTIASTATVSASTGSVNWIHRTTGKVLREVKLGDEMRTGMVLDAGERSSVTLDLGTGVRVMVQPETQMGLRQLRLLSTGKFDALLDVPKGRVVVTTPSSGASEASGEASVTGAAVEEASVVRRVRVQTPSAVLAVRGTRFEAGVTQKATLLSTQTGTVSMRRGGRAIQVHAGSGVVAEQGALLPSTTEVLPPPPIVANLPAQVQQLPLQFDLSRTGVSRWRALVARDASMTQVLNAQKGEAPTQVDWVSLPNGRYVMQLQAVSSSGLTGLPTLHAFEVAVPRTQMGPLRWLNKAGGFKLDVPPAPVGQRWLVQLSVDPAVEQTLWQGFSSGGELTVPSGVAPKGAYLGLWLLARQDS